MQQKFELGETVITRNAYDTLNTFDVYAGLRMHSFGDWGELCPEDKAANEQALKDDSRILSAYTDRWGNKFWIITECDRSATTILLPEDY
ncbi:MAG: hypothetical protein BGO01_08560 [Armatimonadetes bacterium 55-13]|nr:hypothetical protein [Armatimonadota bacterium]OJU62518.1 MAG: hypothetical protein BGO01_08560 [Armatimonadetes bacterium 55-13]